jgi:hypothetical protein
MENEPSIRDSIEAAMPEEDDTVEAVVDNTPAQSQSLLRKKKRSQSAYSYVLPKTIYPKITLQRQNLTAYSLGLSHLPKLKSAHLPHGIQKPVSIGPRCRKRYEPRFPAASAKCRLR